MKKLSLMLAVALVASIAMAGNIDKKARSRIADIQKGENNSQQIRTLRVLDNAIIGGSISVGGGLTNTGPMTVPDLTVTTSLTVNSWSYFAGDSTVGADLTVEDTITLAGGEASSAADLILSNGTFDVQGSNGWNTISNSGLEIDSASAALRYGYAAGQGWELSTLGGGLDLQFAGTTNRIDGDPILALTLEGDTGLVHAHSNLIVGLNAEAGSYSVGGDAGVSGTWTNLGGQTLVISNGLIVTITQP